ncbi:hypothetical protein F441_19691 [Phytophthora nicotianae CJ01A1]|uniref:Uncharacterized protein n=4 Tax=Phytophthora nicotianae TaxID=4792 RepID=V9E4N0_PHYNI|nr:hypothetical protein F443_19836 [Phytophthora nicotianae P1569]ETM33708.1 hypothetical protein L914_19084 [Phytophthora nicotianae]ETO62259.1 hypothetical protein F444_19827 [Phytophthora nicotianae P1976]ETP03363.1 hypothetical protein F441_19691 [Phytophthora nicotianae CJ01A1]
MNPKNSFYNHSARCWHVEALCLTAGNAGDAIFDSWFFCLHPAAAMKKHTLIILQCVNPSRSLKNSSHVL